MLLSNKRRKDLGIIQVLSMKKTGNLNIFVSKRRIEKLNSV